MTIATLSIVSHGHAVLLENLLRDLSRQAGIEQFKVVVTLNLPGESFEPAWGRGLPLIVRRNDKPAGFGANHNRAFGMSEGKWFIVVNPDIRMLDHTALLRLVRDEPGQLDAAIRAPIIVNSEGRREDSVRRNLTPWSLLQRVLGLEPGPMDTALAARPGSPFYWLAGMFLAIESEAFSKVRGFDERFFLYCEDYDLCARLYLSGYGVAQDDTVNVVHNAQRTSHRSMRYLRWHISSLIRVWFSRPFWKITLQSHRTRREPRGGGPG